MGKRVHYLRTCSLCAATWWMVQSLFIDRLGPRHRCLERLLLRRLINAARMIGRARRAVLCRAGGAKSLMKAQQYPMGTDAGHGEFGGHGRNVWLLWTRKRDVSRMQVPRAKPRRQPPPRALGNATLPSNNGLQMRPTRASRAFAAAQCGMPLQPSCRGLTADVILTGTK